MQEWKGSKEKKRFEIEDTQETSRPGHNCCRERPQNRQTAQLTAGRDTMTAFSHSHLTQTHTPPSHTPAQATSSQSLLSARTRSMTKGKKTGRDNIVRKQEKKQEMCKFEKRSRWPACDPTFGSGRD